MGLFNGDGSGSGILGGGTTVCPAAPTPTVGTARVVNSWTVQQLFIVLAGAFTAAACLISMLLFLLHATHFSNPLEQTKIMRIIFFVPVLALISFGDIFLQGSAIYLLPWAAVYEAFAMASYFMMVNVFISPDHSSEAQFFDTLKLKNGKIAGANSFTKFRRGVFQFTPIAILLAAATDITMAANVCCLTTNSVHFAKIWLTIIKFISVGVAAFSTIKFTFQVKSALKERKIMSKLVALKIVILLEAIQNIVFTFIGGNVNPTQQLGYYDLTVGIPSLMLCVELFLVSIVLHFTYLWRPYTLSRSPVGARYHGVGSAILSTLNAADVAREFAYGFGLASPKAQFKGYEQDSRVSLHPYEPLDPPQERYGGYPREFY